MTNQEQLFFNSIWSLCLDAAAQSGVHPEIIFAQAALESGYGLHHPQNNYFGIKGAGDALQTTEFVNGVAQHVAASFAGFAGMADSVAGYSSFILRNRRYRAFRSPGSIAVQLAALGASGYATDPNYIHKLGPIIDGIPDLERNYHSPVGVVVRATTKPITVMPPPVVSIKQEDPMSDLSKFLNSNAGVVNVAADLLKGVMEFAPGIPPGVSNTVLDVVSALQTHAANSQALAAGVASGAVAAVPAANTGIVPPAVLQAVSDVATAAKVAFIAPDATATSVAQAVSDAATPHVDGPAATAVAAVTDAANTAAVVPAATPLDVVTAVTAAAQAPKFDFAAELKAFEGSALQAAINDAKALLPEVLHDFMGGGGVTAIEQDALATGGKIAADIGQIAETTFQPHRDPTKN